MRIIERLGLTEEMLKTKNYQIKIIRESENELIGFIDFKPIDAAMLEYINGKFYINKVEKPLDWIK